jgi:post-segregation antitoxin (ccd killing protein)
MTRKPSGSAAKRAANVSGRRDLLDAARAANINLSATLEHALFLLVTYQLARISKSSAGVA